MILGVDDMMPTMPAARKPTGEQMDQALAELRRAGNAMDPANLDDPVLNHALAPFRGRRPLRIRCPRSGCRGTVAYVALAPSNARAIFSVNGPRKGVVERRNRGGPPRHLMRQPDPPFNYWSLGPSGGIDSAEPATPQGTTTNLRWRFTCRKCGTPSVLTNGTMIAKIIAAHAGNARDITP